MSKGSKHIQLSYYYCLEENGCFYLLYIMSGPRTLKILPETPADCLLTHYVSSSSLESVARSNPAFPWFSV